MTPCQRAPILLLTIAAFAVAGCSTGRHYQVDAEEFLALLRGGVGSVRSQQLIGATATEVYLEVWTGMPGSLGGGTDIYSTVLAGLPSDVRAALAAGKNPFAEARAAKPLAR